MSVNTGKRVTIETPLSAGPAGMIKKADGTVHISFGLDGRRQMPGAGKTLTIDGMDYEVLESRPSEYSRSTALVIARKLAA